VACIDAAFLAIGAGPSTISESLALPNVEVGRGPTSIVCDLAGLRFRSPDASGAGVEVAFSVVLLMFTPGCVAVSSASDGRSVVDLRTTLPAEEKIPPRMSRVDVSKKAMSSMFGSTMDSAICR
jgi:hypothetical protein